MKTTLTLLVAIASMLAVAPSQAATQDRRAQHLPGNMCQLSIPTTDTKVRPKATGFRNEGTQSAFVICSFPSAEGGIGSAISQELYFYSIDGVARTLNCTAVAGEFPGSSDSVYLTQSITVSETLPNNDFLYYSPADFGYTTYLPESFSVTCILPPNTAIRSGYTNSVTDVGS